VTMPPAGWYPDPAGEENIRYWDGQAWSDRVQPKTMPPPPAAPVQPAVPQPDAAPDPGSPPHSAWPPYQQPAGQQPGAAGYPPQAPQAGYPAQAGPPGYPQQPPQLQDPWGGYPAAPPPAAPLGKVGPDGQLLSGWWRRAGGWVVDSIIVGIPATVAFATSVTIIESSGGTVFDEAALEELTDRAAEGDSTLAFGDILDVFGPGFLTALVISAAVWLVLSLINGVYLVSRSGQTLGDRAVKVRKVMAGRFVPTFGIALARWLIPNVLFRLVGNLVPFGFLLEMANYFWAAVDSKSQTLHDKMVRTYVERADLNGPPTPRR